MSADVRYCYTAALICAVLSLHLSGWALLIPFSPLVYFLALGYWKDDAR